MTLLELISLYEEHADLITQVNVLEDDIFWNRDDPEYLALRYNDLRELLNSELPR